ncbi:MAG TPA: DUF4282 domain-containing protein [Candidatus Corynebacterium avicola]|uniref:DUF4282 domain-containing protein n=1 Tax=Candidatus Corynebacterium avicola TaxID=2838527 RepID=A0A9D1RRZ4_9CORY|nr:DUF4282 domain-containing protein [Candidatus Corynebacterium avicola]
MTTPGNGNGNNGGNDGDNGSNDPYRNGWGSAGGAGNGGSSGGSGASGFPSFGSYPQGGGGQDPLYGAGAAAPTPPPNTGTNQDQLFASLFNFGFTRYATPSIVKIAYALGVISLGLLWVVSAIALLVGGVSGNGDGGDFIIGLFGLVILSIWLLFMLMLLRMSLENFLSNVRIAQATQSMDYRQATQQQGR